jgi:serine phosphatase RsbU (regulator of sigma subunit)/ABC-type amino acid transport substrate-binding protein
MKTFLLLLTLLLFSQLHAAHSFAANRLVTVGIYQDAPIVFKDTNGKAKGMYIDILEFIAEQEEWKLQYRSGLWHKCLERLEKGEIDILVGIAHTDERSEKYDFNQESMVTNWAQVYARENSKIRELIDLSGKRVAGVKGDVYYETFQTVMERFGIRPRYVDLDSYAAVLTRVDLREVDAGIVSRLYGAARGKQYRIKKTPINFRPSNIRYAALKGKNTELIQAIDRHLGQLKQNRNSIYYRSMNLWLEGVHQLAFPRWLKPVWVALAIGGVLVLIMAGNVILRWQVRVRTQALKQTIAAKERIESELRVAHDIQMELVPTVFPPFPHRSEFEIHAALEPAKAVGGDFYDFFFTDDHHLCFVIGDVSGKGVPAALFMAAAKTLIKSSARALLPPDQVLDVVNGELSAGNESCTFVTCFFGILDVNTGAVDYANAGHNPPLVIHQGGEARLLEEGGGPPIGFDEDITVTRSRLHLGPGDVLCMYTDGVTEALNAKGEQFSEDQLVKIATRHGNDSLEDMTSAILHEVKSFAAHTEQFDDITLLVLRYLHHQEKRE